MPKVHTRGKKMATENRLYMSWTDAAEKALRNWLRSPAAPSDTRVEVIVVPTLAPIRIETAVARGRPPATIPTTIEVVVRSEEHTSELQSRFALVCSLLLEKTT